MNKRALFLALMLCFITVNSNAQDPFKVAPQAYRLQFENDWVKVVRVHYEPHEKIQAHDHPKRGTIFVYLKDGGPVRFSHVGEESYALTRPAIKARGFRLARPVTERHEVENLSDLSSDFLRVELKTAPVDTQTLRGRFPPPDTGAEKSYRKVEFENGWVRITRLFCKAHDRLPVSDGLPHPALVVAISEKVSSLSLGETRWINAGQKEEIKNNGGADSEALLIEFKSEPQKN